MLVVRPATKYHGVCGRLDTAAGVPSVSPGKKPPMSTWVVVAVARHEVPLIAKIVVKPDNSEVILLGSVHIRGESLNVDTVAAAETAARFIRRRHVFVPELLHQGVDSDAQRIEVGYVILHRVSIGVGEGGESGAHGR